MHVLQHKVDVQMAASDRNRTPEAVFSKRGAHVPVVKEDKRLQDNEGGRDKNKRQDLTQK